MAIFPNYTLPKYKSPVRITKPYMKPNRFADAIIGGIGAYTNMQGMNLKKQMFMAQMAQQQKAIADKQAQQDALVAQLRNESMSANPQTNLGVQGYLGGAGPNFEPTQRVTNPTFAAIANFHETGLPIGNATSLARLLHPQAQQPNALSFGNLLAKTKWQDKLDQRQIKSVADANDAAGRMIEETFGIPLRSDFQHKQDEWFGFDPEAGTESTLAFIEDAEWRGETGPQAYRNMVSELKKVASKMILGGNVGKEDIMLALQEMYLAGSKDHSEGWQQPEIPAALQSQMDALATDNQTRADAHEAANSGQTRPGR